MSDLNLLQWIILIAAAVIVWSLLAVVVLMVFHGASRLKEEARSADGVKRGNVHHFWHGSRSVHDSDSDPSRTKSASRW